MANIKYYCTTLAKLNEIPVEVGNLIFCEDARKIYLDTENGRTNYDQIMCIPLESQRIPMTRNLVSGFYYVLDTNILWRLDDVTWIQITEKPSSQIVYGTLESFPRPGIESCLYMTSTNLYHWNPDTYSYDDYSSATPQWIEN